MATTTLGFWTQEILYALFWCFGLFSIIGAFMPRKRWQTGKHSFQAIDQSACILIALAGVIFCAVWGIESYPRISTADPNDRILGPLWYMFHLQPSYYLILTQLLWIPFIRNQRWIRLLLGILLLIGFENAFNIFATLHRDYLPSRWAVSPATDFIRMLIHILIFIVALALTYSLQTLTKRKHG